MGDKEQMRGMVFIQVFSGLGMGLLVGFIVGMSVSEVVSIILGALAALLAAFLGLQDQQASKQGEDDPVKAFNRAKMLGLRAGTFGIACVAAILIGVFFRTHNTLSTTEPEPTLKEQVQVWIDAGYDKKEALQYVAYQNLNILPKTLEVKEAPAGKPAGAGVEAKAKLAVLFSGEGAANFCSDLSFERNESSVEKTLEAYRATKDPKLIELADNIQNNVPDGAKMYLLKSIEEVMCKIQDYDNNVELYVSEENQTKVKQSFMEVIWGL